MSSDSPDPAAHGEPHFDVVVRALDGGSAEDWALHYGLNGSKRWGPHPLVDVESRSCVDIGAETVVEAPVRNLDGWDAPKASTPKDTFTMTFPPGVEVVRAYATGLGGCEPAVRIGGTTEEGESWKFYPSRE